MNMERYLPFDSGTKKHAEIYSKALTVTLKDCKYTISTESYLKI